MENEGGQLKDSCAFNTSAVILGKVVYELVLSFFPWCFSPTYL